MRAGITGIGPSAAHGRGEPGANADDPLEAAEAWLRTVRKMWPQDDAEKKDIKTREKRD